MGLGLVGNQIGDARVDRGGKVGGKGVIDRPAWSPRASLDPSRGSREAPLPRRGFPLHELGGRSLTSPIFELKWASMPRTPGSGARKPGLEGGAIVFGVPENPGERSGGARIGPLDDLGALESTCVREK